VIVFRYVSSSFLRALTAALVGMSSIYLIIDFADRAKQYTGPGIFKALVVLYTCKLALIVYQLAPAALGLAGAIAMSSLRKTNEVTALQALGRGPGTFLWPLGLCAALFALTLTLAEDRVVAPATEKAEAITFGVFPSGWGDWSRYHLEKKWYRGQNNRIYYLGHFEGAGFRDVTIYDLTPDFRLNRRVDADQIEPLPDGRWRFLNATTRTFDPL
jgi:lipopolysaccharide export system permease protein